MILTHRSDLSPSYNRGTIIDQGPDQQLWDKILSQ